jgi:hypothetical protein
MVILSGLKVAYTHFVMTPVKFLFCVDQTTGTQQEVLINMPEYVGLWEQVPVR